MNELLDWSFKNRVIINSKKTKEMILGSHKNNHPKRLCVGNAETESIFVFKLLGVHSSHDLNGTIILIQYSRKLHLHCISSNY